MRLLTATLLPLAFAATLSGAEPANSTAPSPAAPAQVMTAPVDAVVTATPANKMEQTTMVKTPAKTDCSADQSSHNGAHMWRGVVNICTCFFELPRCMILGNSRLPFFGFIGGAVEGVGLTGVRCFAGLTDVIFLGFDPGRIYSKNFAPYVWNSPWQLPARSTTSLLR
ncbi:MAG: hypothetical protein PHS41_05055 [Victivallaceae bacterium]|nr:hypothetical protein [Victivallaceae bacterium]